MANFIAVSDFLSCFPEYVTVGDIQAAVGKGFKERSDVVLHVIETAKRRIAGEGK